MQRTSRWTDDTDSSKPTSTKCPVNCQINKQDSNHLGPVTWQINLSDHLHMHGHIVTPTSWPGATRLVQDPIDSLLPRTIWQLSLYFWHHINICKFPCILLPNKTWHFKLTISPLSSLPSPCHITLFLKVCRIDVFISFTAKYPSLKRKIFLLWF